MKGAAPLAISTESLRHLQALLRAACGFRLRDDLKYLVERRLAVRLRHLGLADFRAYVRFLEGAPGGAAELEAVVERLVPRETYFFREPQQLGCFVRYVVPALRLRGMGEMRVWSAGCSTGEEAYTLAMLLAAGGEAPEVGLDVLGTDLSRSALDRARKGEYGRSALRATSPLQEQQFFTEGPTGRVKVRPAYRSPVRFEHLNLLDAAEVARLPRMDAIFCRNVLIYFDDATRMKVVDLFYDRLRPGGLLLLGHAEHLLTLNSRFEFLQLPGDLVYRRSNQ